MLITNFASSSIADGDNFASTKSVNPPFCNDCTTVSWLAVSRQCEPTSWPTYCSFFRNTTETQDMDFANGLPQILIWVVYLFTATVGIWWSQCVYSALLFVMEMMVLTPCCEWQSQIICPGPMILAMFV